LIGLSCDIFSRRIRFSRHRPADRRLDVPLTLQRNATLAGRERPLSARFTTAPSYAGSRTARFDDCRLRPRISSLYSPDDSRRKSPSGVNARKFSVPVRNAGPQLSAMAPDTSGLVHGYQPVNHCRIEQSRNAKLDPIRADRIQSSRVRCTSCTYKLRLVMREMMLAVQSNFHNSALPLSAATSASTAAPVTRAI
jgi:hypothetical protein